MPLPEAERPLVVHCADAQLLAILHPGAADASCGLVLVVGGPQYRVGSHRQFVLLARRLAAAGIPVLRFDYRGMGDSEGALRSFEDIQPDIRAAVDRLLGERPGIRRVVLWGLCDAASAIAVYAPSDPRVAGLVLLNPWVRTQAGVARAYLRHYYARRLASAGFWRKALVGGIDLRRSLGMFFGFLRSAGGPQSPGTGPERQDAASAPDRVADADPAAPGALPERMLAGLDAFRGQVLVILSGRDLTAKEFAGMLHAHRGWRRWAGRTTVARADLPEADHTFSSAPWRDRVERATLEWLSARCDR